MSDLVSIILPVFNGENYLAQSIGSCLNQTYTNLELIIVNDCSTDGSLGIAEKFAGQDSRIKIISNDSNLQLPASLNAGHRLAKGEFLTWTSDDNFFEPQALEILLENLISLKADIVFSNFNIVEEDGSFRRETGLGKGGSLILGNTIGACFLYRREVYKRNRGYDEDLHTIEDYDFWLRALVHSSFSHVPAVLYNFRSHGSSLSSNLEHKDLKFREKLERSYSKFLEDLNLLQERKYASFLASLHQHKEIDLLSLLHNYSEIERMMEVITIRIGRKEAAALQRELDLRVRDNLQHYPANQNLKVLLKICFARPQVFLRYDKRRSLEILLKCFAF